MTFEESIKRRAVEIRNRLMNPGTVKAPEAKPVLVRPKLDPVTWMPKKAKKPAWTDATPLWMWTMQTFDAHVRVWKSIQRAAKPEEEKEILAVEAFFAPDPKREIKDIIAEVLARYPGITWQDISGKHRGRRVVEARQECMHELYRLRKDLSFPFIGRLFGGRDHTTVMYACKKMAGKEAGE